MNETPKTAPSDTPPTAPPPAGVVTAPATNYGSPKYVWPAAVVLAVLIYFGLAYLADTFTHESTDDAFIAGHVVSIAPRVAGQVAAVHVLDNQLVHSYDLLRAKVTTAESSARKSRADVDSAASTANRTQLDLNRAQDLLKQTTISKQEFDTTQAADTKAQADLKSAQENADEEDSKVDESKKQLRAVLAQKDMALAQVSESQTNIVAANLNLSYTKIFAPCAGCVTRKAVETGDYLQSAQQVMSIVPDEVWVIANFKESQLDKMRTNQPVTVEIDALGGRAFRAHVESIQAGSGAAFSLLPPENATGNFVKVIQRVPVKIVFDKPLEAAHVLGPGMSVVPSIKTASFEVPDPVSYTH